MIVFDTFQKVISLDVDDEQGKLAEKDLQDTYGENHVTFLKCDVTKGAEFQSMKLELSHKLANIKRYSVGICLLLKEPYLRQLKCQFRALNSYEILSMENITLRTDWK